MLRIFLILIVFATLNQTGNGQQQLGGRLFRLFRSDQEDNVNQEWSYEGAVLNSLLDPTPEVMRNPMYRYLRRLLHHLRRVAQWARFPITMTRRRRRRFGQVQNPMKRRMAQRRRRRRMGGYRRCKNPAYCRIIK